MNPLKRDKTINCEKCKGVMFNVTPKMAIYMGVFHYQCEKCKNKIAVKIK
jgi:predicted  nucleic acid-binding Zn ribbon protein